ncbi:MAG: aminotransferase class V-fold PLP-dependent enzyme [Chryseolinea sp.]
MSPLMKDVEKIGVKSLRQRRDPSSILPSDFFNQSNQLREDFASLINAPDPSRIVIIPSASYGLSTAAQNIRAGKGDNIIVAAEQFPSNYYPWQRMSMDTGAKVKSIGPPEDGIERGKKWNEKILEAIDTTTKVVAIGNVHWADGTLFQLSEIRKRTREVGALLIVDGTQSIGALPFDLQQIQPDALVCAGYKWLFGPYSIGLAYFGEYFSDGRPIEESWMNRLYSENFSALLNYQPEYQPGALRYEVGEHSNFNLVPMLLKSIQQLKKWGVANIQSYCKEITSWAIHDLMEKGYWIESEEYRCSHLFGVRLNGRDIQKLKVELLKNKVFVSFRGNAIRVSPNVYNTPRDLAKFVKIMSR